MSIESFPSSEDLTALHKDRLAKAIDFNAYAGPELPQTDAQELYERLVDAERRLAAPNFAGSDYVDGVAEYPDQIGIADGTGRALISTEHATAQMRQYKTGIRQKEDEPGTAALGALLHEDADATHVTMLGRQTGDPNSQPEHPFKNLITEKFLVPEKSLFASIHGMKAGHVSGLTDARAFDAVIGIADTPTEATVIEAERAQQIGTDLGLRVGINQRFIRVASADPFEPRRDENGDIRTIRFGAAGNTTRQHAENVGRADQAALQLEYSSFLRLLPSPESRDYKSRYMGAYMGYLLLRQLVEVK